VLAGVIVEPGAADARYGPQLTRLFERWETAELDDAVRHAASVLTRRLVRLLDPELRSRIDTTASSLAGHGRRAVDDRYAPLKPMDSGRS